MEGKCCICSQTRECVVLTLTDEERAAASKVGTNLGETLAYCKACYKIATDPFVGAQLIKGLLEMRLRASGNPRAEEAGKKLHEFLIRKAKRPVS